MSRCYGDPVDVRRQDEAPAQFLWRGRLYVVREVLAHWTEAGSWWRGALAASMVSGEADASGSAADDPARPFDVRAADLSAGGELVLRPIPSSPRWAQRAWGEPAPEVGAAAGPVGVDDGEREYWRVEAGSGLSTGTGVYDLCFDWATGGWSLARVLD